MKMKVAINNFIFSSLKDSIKYQTIAETLKKASTSYLTNFSLINNQNGNPFLF